MKPEELTKRLEKNKVDSVYFFSGDENFLKEEAIRQLTAAIIEPGTEEFCLDSMNGENTDATTVLTLAVTIPMMAERRIIVVRDFHRLPQKDREVVADYVEHPSASTCLVLVTPKVDLKTKLYSRLSKAATSVVFYALYPERIPAWLQQHVRPFKKRLSNEAGHQLQAIVGTDLGELASELEKLVVFVGNRRTIEAADVEAIMGPSRAGTVFDLAQAIGEKDLTQAHKAYMRAMDAGESPLALVAILVRHLSILWKIRLMKWERQSDEEIKRSLKLGWGFNKFFAQYAAQAGLLTVRDLHGGFEALYQADMSLKTSTRSPHLIMKKLLYDLCVG